jgi:excisionase family DNA binding protein
LINGIKEPLRALYTIYISLESSPPVILPTPSNPFNYLLLWLLYSLTIATIANPCARVFIEENEEKMKKRPSDLSKKETLLILEVSPRTLSNYVEAGKLSVRYIKGKHGQEALYDSKEVEALKKTNETIITRPILAPKTPESQTLPATINNLPPITPELFFEALKALSPAPIRKRELMVTEIAVKPILKIKEASALTGLGERRLKDAIEKKELKAKKLDRSWRIERDDLDRYVKTVFT